jgi:hypothetical protein
MTWRVGLLGFNINGHEMFKRSDQNHDETRSTKMTSIRIDFALVNPMSSARES